MTEQTFPCPKCSQPFAISLLHDHYQTCQGKPIQPVNQWPPSFSPPQFNPQMMNPYDKRDWPPQNPAIQLNPGPYQQPNPMYVAPPVPLHQHQWYENNTYKVCIAFMNPKTAEDVACREIKVKLRGSWQIFLRYGLKMFWILMIIDLAIAFSVASLTGIHH